MALYKRVKQNNKRSVKAVLVDNETQDIINQGGCLSYNLIYPYVYLMLIIVGGMVCKGNNKENFLTVNSGNSIFPSIL